MGLFNHFPYPDTHQLNLDWILDAVKTCVDKVTELWTYVRDPGAGIQKALTDAQAAATAAKTNATNAQASAANARTSAINAEANAANAQTSANDAQTSADDSQTSADNAQAAATTAQTSATSAQTAATSAQTAATSAQTAATSAQEAATSAQAAATAIQEMSIMFKSAFQMLYPVGYLYVNYRNQDIPNETDEMVIERLQSVAGIWKRAGSHGEPVTDSKKFGWATVMLRNAAGDANDTNFDIYVRTK